MIQFVIKDVKAVSVNAAYVNIKGQARRFKSAEGKAFSSAVEGAVEAYIISQRLGPTIANLEGKRLSVAITFQSDAWLTKAGTPRRRDVANMEKLITDSIFNVLVKFCPSLDDSQIFDLRLTKALGSECITYQIEELL